MSMIEKNAKKVSVPCIFPRTALDPQSMKQISAWYQTIATFEVWKESKFDGWSLSLISGYADNSHVRPLKVFLNRKDENGNCQCEELDFHTEFDGLSITRGEEKKITAKEALELIKKGKCRILAESPEGDLVFPQLMS